MFPMTYFKKSLPSDAIGLAPDIDKLAEWAREGRPRIQPVTLTLMAIIILLRRHSVNLEPELMRTSWGGERGRCQDAGGEGGQRADDPDPSRKSGQTVSIIKEMSHDG